MNGFYTNTGYAGSPRQRKINSRDARTVYSGNVLGYPGDVLWEESLNRGREDQGRCKAYDAYEPIETERQGGQEGRRYMPDRISEVPAYWGSEIDRPDAGAHHPGRALVAVLG